MNDYDSTLDLSAVADMLRACDGPIVLLTHAKPDGDAFGSVVALAAALRAMGKPVVAQFVPPVPGNLFTVAGADLVTIHDADSSQADASLPAEPALVVLLDTGAKSQLGPLWTYVEQHLDRTLIFDHHLSGDVPAKHRYVDPTAAATAEPLAELLDLFPLSRPDPVIEEALFTGIASDTGWFRFSNTTSRTHRLAARLRDAGVDHASLYIRLEQCERPEKLHLLARALKSLELLADDKAALMILRQRDFAETGATESETERLIDVPQIIGTVQLAALATERDNGRLTAVSFRSKPGKAAIHAAELANRFGGGGHARAAGAKIRKPLDEALPEIRAALTDAAAHPMDTA